jgi:hypothetical protein
MPVPVSQTPFQSLKPADEQILRWLLRYHYLSSRQLCRLGFSAGSLTYVQTKLKRLSEAGFCQRILVPKRSAHGSAPSVYTLARRGLNHLRAIGLEVPSRFHPSEKRDLSYLFLEHTLRLNDVLISLDALCRGLPHYRLVALRHDYELRRSPVRVRRPDGGSAAVIPDAWLDLRIDEKYQVCLAVELDRAPRNNAAGARRSRT